MSARTGPLPADPAAIQARFASCFAVDGTSLEALLRKLQMQPDQPTAALAHHLSGALDLLSHLPAKLWSADDPATTDTALAPDIVRWLAADTLVVFDLGSFAFWRFDALFTAQTWVVTRRRQKASSSVQQVLVEKPDVRDQISQLGIYKGNRQCQPPRRLVELFVKRRWQR